MNILAFDTCFDGCSAAAARGLRTLTPVIAVEHERMSVGHAERLMPMIQSVMRDARLDFAALDKIVVASGPGTFTGTRIAVAAARALSLATGAPVAPISSLRLMAMNPAIPSAPGRSVAIATDARRGEVYLQLIDRHTLTEITEPRVLRIEDAATTLGPGPMTVAGSGAEAVVAAGRALGADMTAILPELLPDAFDVLFAAITMPVSAAVHPLYLRAPDAKVPAPGPVTRLAASADRGGAP